MNRLFGVLFVLCVAASSAFALTRHYSFSPREAGFGGTTSVIVPVPKKVADAYDRGRDRRQLKELSLIGKVTAVTDGDTITVKPTGGSPSIVKLAGLTAPKGEEAGSVQSLASLSALIKDKKVTVKYRVRDRAGIVSGVVWLGKVNVNKSMVVSGFARAADTEYEDDQRQARFAKRGIWAVAK